MTLDYVPPRHSAALSAMLARPQPLHHDLLENGEIVTDAYNRAVHDMAESQLIYRQEVVRALPAAFLVN
ncbi:MAG: hypothetical protein AMJ67_02220 [Betaproteobacteria bacterium SG8_41]|nr:MAG: hypothetical protein AMJ67_02220 [Betaproteobacteria bacterium SG8_41]